MTTQILIDQLANEIRTVYGLGADKAEERIEQFLERKLKDLSDSERLNVMETLVSEFGSTPYVETHDLSLDKSVMSSIFSLLLGRDVPPAEMSSTELLERLAESLNTIFDSLNRLISVINRTLHGEDTENQMIRTIIGFQLEGEAQKKSLESYIGQINNAFLTVQRAFKEAARIKIGEILQEIDPDQISALGGGGLKIGPLKKAEYYEIYEEKFQTIKKWFESDRFMEDFQREFEKNCQKFSEE
jgi:hypothetical protein